MDRPDLTQLKIEIAASDANEEDIDYMTRQLLSELREMDVESAELVRGGPAPTGTKGDSFTIGAIAVEILPAAIPGLVKFVQAWMMRGRGRTVKFKGMGIEFEGSAEDLERLLAILEGGKKRK